MKDALALALEIYWANEQPSLEKKIERLIELLKWQPIETAPKGVDVLRFEPREYRRGQISLHERIVLSSGAYPRQATHWMPAPAPPSDAKPSTERSEATPDSSTPDSVETRE